METEDPIEIEDPMIAYLAHSLWEDNERRRQCDRILENRGRAKDIIAIGRDLDASYETLVKMLMNLVGWDAASARAILKEYDETGKIDS